MNYWSAGDIIKQVCNELGLTVDSVSSGTAQSGQMLAALNAAGNELVDYYPWAQFTKEWSFYTQAGMDTYTVPSDWKYFRDMTQWDRTNHWPMLGPKSPSEWAWLKGGIVASFPRTRYRVVGNKFIIFPAPPVTNFTAFNLAMEYISCNWVNPDGSTPSSMVTADGDVVAFDPWLAVKYLKLKWYQLKNFDTTNVLADFTRVFESLTGKDVGAPVLSLTPVLSPIFIGPQSIPDGNWNTGP